MFRTKRLFYFSVITGILMMISATLYSSDENVDNNLGTSKITSPPVGKTAGESRRTGMDPVDDRVELREYLFTDTNEMLPYAVFVSSKVKKDVKAPLVLALHGFSGNHGTFMRRQCVEEAEKRGYIMVGPMGYSPTGPFGMQMRMPGPPKTGAETPGAKNDPASSAKPKPKPFLYTGGDVGGKKEKDPARVTLLSEKDTMNVLNMALKEFNIDKNRIYLMGHSMGGGGALHIAEKYSDIWAAVAGVAPATFGFEWNAEMKLKNLPLMIIVGEDDTLVKGAAQVADQLKGLGFLVEYKSLPGLDHGEIIGGSMPDVFDFFNRHSNKGAGRKLPPGVFPGSDGGENVMVSLTPPANVKRIKLYEKTLGVITFTENELNPMEPTLDLYIPEAGKATGAGVLICPGGGYEMLTVPGEGGTIAEIFKKHNIAAFVVRYRHGPQYHYPTTLLDAQRALRHIKAHAKEYNVDPDKVGVFGGSAGGHLAAMLATLYNNKLLPEAPYAPDKIDSLSARPAFALLLYPVIDLTDDSITHKGSRTNLTQDNPDLYEALSPWKHVTKDTPPAFIVHGTYDFLVPVKNSLLFYEACIKEKVPAEMHLLDTPMHGFGIGASLNDMTVKDWPEQAIRFVERHTKPK